VTLSGIRSSAPLKFKMENKSWNVCRCCLVNVEFLHKLQELIKNVYVQERSISCFFVLCSTVPEVFCAGADLKERATMTHTETLEFVSSLRKTFGQIQARQAKGNKYILGSLLWRGLGVLSLPSCSPTRLFRRVVRWIWPCVVPRNIICKIARTFKVSASIHSHKQ